MHKSFFIFCLFLLFTAPLFSQTLAWQVAAATPAEVATDGQGNVFVNTCGAYSPQGPDTLWKYDGSGNPVWMTPVTFPATVIKYNGSGVYLVSRCDSMGNAGPQSVSYFDGTTGHLLWTDQIPYTPPDTGKNQPKSSSPRAAMAQLMKKLSRGTSSVSSAVGTQHGSGKSISDDLEGYNPGGAFLDSAGNLTYVYDYWVSLSVMGEAAIKLNQSGEVIFETTFPSPTYTGVESQTYVTAFQDQTGNTWAVCQTTTQPSPNAQTVNYSIAVLNNSGSLVLSMPICSAPEYGNPVNGTLFEQRDPYYYRGGAFYQGNLVLPMTLDTAREVTEDSMTFFRGNSWWDATIISLSGSISHIYYRGTYWEHPLDPNDSTSFEDNSVTYLSDVYCNEDGIFLLGRTYQGMTWATRTYCYEVAGFTSGNSTPDWTVSTLYGDSLIPMAFGLPPGTAHSVPVIAGPSSNRLLVYGSSGDLDNSYEFGIPLVSKAGIGCYASDTSGWYEWSDANYTGSDPNWGPPYEFVYKFWTPSEGAAQRAGRWQLVSLPYVTSHDGVSAVFPGAVSGAFGFDGSGYIEESALQNGPGYWVDIESIAPPVTVTQENALPSVSVNVRSGWNMVGSLSNMTIASQTTSEPPGMTTSKFFAYRSGTYIETDTVMPGEGYWVRVTQTGTLTMSGLGKASGADRIHMTLTGVKPPPPPAGAAVKTPAVPKKFALNQNYPNPFNPTTRISFVLPADGFTTLAVYNILGQKVTELEHGMLKAGTYSYTWNAGAMSSGVYFYRLGSGSYVETKKLLLMK